MLKGFSAALFLLLCFTVHAQTFKGGALIGINATQVDGDDLVGYNKIGINGGFYADLPLGGKWSASMELLYSQKGSKSKPITGLPQQYLLRLDYASIPFLINFHDKQKISFGTGVAINRLVHYHEEIYSLATPGGIPSTFKRNEYSWIANGNYLITEHWVFNLRYEYSILPIGHSVISNYQGGSQYNNVITGRIGFIF